MLERKVEKKMNVRSITQSAMLLAIGTILHLIPGFVNGIKPDFMLVCVFLAIILDPNFKTAIAIGLSGGILAGMTTSMPGGFLPNVVDKVVASILVYILVNLFLEKDQKSLSPLKEAIIFFVGTFVSGVVFLAGMILTVGLPGGVGLGQMVLVIVLPTSAMNIVVGLFFSKIIKGISRR